uniref:TFIIS N-terminal domain-containing protein n=1 Tax=Wuchereria bancrofti TaxID=6293 RepID=A0AAF5Q4B6_WUCBA
MAELEEGDIADNGFGSFEISQEDDGITPLSPVQSDYVGFNVVEDDGEKDNSSSRSHFSLREFIFPVCETEGEVKEENVVNQDENLEQNSETKERIDHDRINMNNETEKGKNVADKQAGPSKPRRNMLSSNEEDNIDATPAAGSQDDFIINNSFHVFFPEMVQNRKMMSMLKLVGELMTNIFGQDSDDEKEGEDVQAQYQAERNGLEGDDDEPRYVCDENDEDDGVNKAERQRPRRPGRDGSIDVVEHMMIKIKRIINAMKSAAKDDRHSNMERRPALQKRKMLPHVKAMLIKHDLMEAIIDNGMMYVISEWLAPLPDKSLAALEIRTDLLKILQDFSRLEPGTLKQSGPGRAVMLLYKHSRETKENKALAARLISDWARPIFRSLLFCFSSGALMIILTIKSPFDRDFCSVIKDEHIQLRKPRPGDKSFIMRVHVPRPSQKDYVVRPKSNVEGQFRGATKNRSNSRFDRTQRNSKTVAVTINRVNI